MALDRITVLRGAASGLLLGTPATLLNSSFAGAEPRQQVPLALTYIAVLLSFLVAGLVASSEAEAEPRPHALAAAAVAFVPLQALALLGRFDRGVGLSIPAIVILGLLAAGAANTGSHFGAQIRARRLAKDPQL